MMIKSIKIAIAAILGTLMVTSTALAQIHYVPGATAADPVTFTGRSVIPKEVVVSAGSRRADADGGPYYMVTGSATGYLRSRFPVTVTKPANQTALVRITLQGMVFPRQIADGDLVVRNFADAADVANTSATVASGGGIGTKEVIFSVTGSAAATAGANWYRFQPHSLAVSAAGGSISMAQRLAIEGVPFSSPQTIPEAITIVDAIKDTDASTNLVADVGMGFMKFTGDTTMASLGMISLGVESVSTGTSPKRYIRQNTTAADADYTSTGGLPGRATLSTATVAFSGGDVSFAERVYLSSNADCSGSPASTLTEEVDGATVWKTSDLPGASDFPSARHVCIEVDGETEIPATPPFVATIQNVAIAGAAFPPVANDTRTLGRITRGGVTFRIPFVSSFAGYNHRLVLTNHSAARVSYGVSFTTEDGVTATPGDGANGMLPPNSVTVVPSADLVSLAGGGRAAMIVELEAESRFVEVATVLINREDGSTDTVVYQPES